MTRAAKGGAIDRAKQLQGKLVRLAERRERHVRNATGDFILDLNAAIIDQPQWLVAMVRQALAQDAGQSFLYLQLVEAMSRHGEAETERPPPLLDLDDIGIPVGDDEPDEPLPRPPPLPDALTEAATERMIEETFSSDERADVPPPTALAYRYPEPGEEAIELPDGTIVAASPAPAYDERGVFPES
jgi:hypothetical protein